MFRSRYDLSAIAALTAQHARGVTAVHVPSVDFLREQIDAVADALERHRPDCDRGENEDVDDQPARP